MLKNTNLFRIFFGKYSKLFYICTRNYRTEALKNIAKESCLSGRKDLFAKQACGKLYQGFESLTLRNFQKKFFGA